MKNSFNLFLKTFIIITIVCSSILLTSCGGYTVHNETYTLTYRFGFTVIQEGLENWTPHVSSLGLTCFLFPYEKDHFLETYEYQRADYYYNDQTKFMYILENIERGITIFEYDEAVYEEAKAYCLENANLLEDDTFEYNQFVFIPRNVPVFEDFPNEFGMFAFNDSEYTLIYMVFDANGHPEAGKLAENDWGAFLEKYYGEYYSFD